MKKGTAKGGHAIQQVLEKKNERWTMINSYAPQMRSKKQTEYSKEMYNLQKINTRKIQRYEGKGGGGRAGLGVVEISIHNTEHDEQDKDSRELKIITEVLELEAAEDRTQDVNASYTCKQKEI